ncbi:MAG: pesticidal protein Cry7Aa [Lutibacter sp.]|jgi:predicted GH43/DUF377 family glycosyl hydrolase
MLTVTKHGVVLEKTENVFENLGVLNPAIYQEGNTVHMFYRAVREGNFSSIGYCKLDGPTKVIERSKEPIFFPKESYEFHGTEDPRITKIDDTFYMPYVAFDGINVFGAYATSKDLKKFERQGVITPKLTFDEYATYIKQNTKKISGSHIDFYKLFQYYNIGSLLKGKIYVWDKDVVFFPKKINGKFAVLHRLFPSIQIMYFNDPKELTTEFWEEYICDLQKHILLSPKGEHQTSHIGAGCPPIETDWGWLLIYHSASHTPEGYIYYACAALFDLKNPMKLIARLKQPLFSPTEIWEKDGYVNNVVFPTGTAIFNNELYIYYGAADSRVAVASVNLDSLLKELKKE